MDKPFVARHVLRLQNLSGGSYGTLELVVTSPAAMEVRLGADFVRLSREHVKALCEAGLYFLELGRPKPPRAPREHVESREEAREEREEGEHEEARAEVVVEQETEERIDARAMLGAATTAAGKRRARRPRA